MRCEMLLFIVKLLLVILCVEWEEIEEGEGRYFNRKIIEVNYSNSVLIILVEEFVPSSSLGFLCPWSLQVADIAS